MILLSAASIYMHMLVTEIQSALLTITYIITQAAIYYSLTPPLNIDMHFMNYNTLYSHLLNQNFIQLPFKPILYTATF